MPEPQNFFFLVPHCLCGMSALQISCRQLNELLVNVTRDITAALDAINDGVNELSVLRETETNIQELICFLQEIGNLESTASATFQFVTVDATRLDQCQCENVNGSNNNGALITSLISILKKISSVASLL
jgi:hypothetical protein